MLLHHYDNQKKIEDLILHVGGYASALKDTPEQTREESVHRESIEYHSSEEELMDSCDNSDLEFIYLFKNGVWYVSQRNSVVLEDRYQGSYYYYWTKFVKLADQKEVQPKPELKVVH
jgi:membrane-bound inhibitor of C-type lysozyme